MSKNYTEIYYEDTVNLAATLTIKSELSAKLLNTYLIQQYGTSEVDTNDPTSWKYYMNISGIYHKRDTMMSVVSLDTMTEINFTKENLRLHTDTAKAYQFGTRYYKTLVSKYPEQEQLIKGILYPCDINIAVSANDNSILAYQTDLIEDQETTLIADLNDWITRFNSRWSVTAFTSSHSLYPASQHAIMYLNLVPAILNLRLDRCKTNEAHSFHIRNYLASHGRLDAYIDYMTTKQKLWLYRNIVHIEHNSGNKYVFDWLKDHLLSERYIPISEYSIRHLDTFGTDYRPDFIIRRKALNTQYNAPEKDTIEYDNLIEKEIVQATENKNYYSNNKSNIEDMIKHSVSSVIRTKDLESTIQDYDSSTPFTFNEVALNHWMYMSGNGYYKVVVNYKHPRTGVSRTLFSDDAFLYLFYLAVKRSGQDLTTIPTFYANYIVKPTLPNVSELVNLCDETFTEAYETAVSILSTQPKITKCYSRTSFYSKLTSIYNQRNYNWTRTSMTFHPQRRAMVESMCKYSFMDSVVTFADSGMDYSTWLADKDLSDYDEFTDADFESIVTSIYENVTGIDTNPYNSVIGIQQAMLAIFRQLSSYSIQIVSDVNIQKLYVVGWPALRSGDIVAQVKNSEVIDPTVEIKSFSTDLEHCVDINVEWVGVNSSSDHSPTQTTALDPLVTTSVTLSNETTISALRPIRNTSLTYDGFDAAKVIKHGMYGAELLYKLTDDQRKTLVDLY